MSAPASAAPVITALRWVPPGARGLVRDLRARWAFEEVGQPYRTHLLELTEIKQPPHRARQPFGQVPTLDDGEVAMFESGAIVLHLARRYPGLLPADPAGEARAVEWLFAALSSVEPWIYSVQLAALFERDQPWSAERLPHALAQLDARLADLAAALGDGPWLDGDSFTAGDLMMVAVLRQVSRIGALDRHPTLADYVARGEARPAFARALAAQMDDFEQRAA